MTVTPKTVLIAEDSGLQAQLLRRGLEAAGYQVIEARDGEQALAFATAARPDVVLSGIQMPRLDGYALCRAIRHDKALSGTPVILQTDLSDPLDVIRGLDAGADAFVTKPYDFPSLVSRIETLTAVPSAPAGERRRSKVRASGDIHEVATHTPRILNLLISTYENAVLQQRQLSTAQRALEYLNATIEQRVLEKTDRIRKRVRALKLLQGASRLLSVRRFDRAALEELVKMIPAAWERPDRCSASITFRDVTVTTPGWRPTRWRQSVSFTTSGGTGTIEVAYEDESTIGDTSPFLAEEAEVLDSLAEMLVTYAERDVAEERRKSLESQLRHAQKMEALGTLAGGIAHDFNNILSAIGGNTELALNEDPTNGIRESLNEINKAVVRAKDLVGRILLFSRRQESERKPVALASIVEEVLTLLRASIPRSVEVWVRCVPDLPMISADASQIHQVIMNLGTNAAHAMEHRGGTLTMEVDRVSVDAANAPSPDLVPGPYLRVTVSDTGAGINPEVVDRIFDPFFTTKGHEGTGLGLAVVDGIVRDHQGAITVESAVGRGTTFRLYFPEAGPTAGAVAATGKVSVKGAGQHVMYVDDEEALVLVMTRLLESLGYRCTGFVDPHDALQAFRVDPHAFDAVIADLSMSSMSGLDLARALVGIRADVPVAIISGYTADPGARSAHGVRARIHKPATMSELSSALADLLRSGGKGILLE